MINECSVHAKPKNNNAKILFGVLLAAALVLMIVSRIIDLYKGVLALCGIVFLTASVLVYTRYIGASYYYDITSDSEGYPLFVVRQLVGNRYSTLCRIGLNEITSINRETAAERNAHKTPYGTRKYVYLATLGAEVSYRLITKSRYESSEIIIEVSDEYASLLSGYVDEAKTIVIEDDEY